MFFIVGLRLEASESVVIMILRLIILVAGDRGDMTNIPRLGCVLSAMVLPTIFFPRLRSNGLPQEQT